MSSAHITISVPYYKSLRYIKRAVESLLAQSYKEIRIVVVNDGDHTTPPWPELAHIIDPRLIRYDLKDNQGPYFIHDLVLKACRSPFFCIQDADDTSSPHRLDSLMKELMAQHADFAFSAENVYSCSGADSNFTGIRWQLPGTESTIGAGSTNPEARFTVDPLLTPEFKNRAGHHALFRTGSLLRLGGYYGGFRMNYDTLLTNFLLMTGKMAFIEEPLYDYFIRNDSLSNSSETGAHSPIRQQIKQKQAMLYSKAFDLYKSFSAGTITAHDFITHLDSLRLQNVPKKKKLLLDVESSNLTSILKNAN